MSRKRHNTSSAEPESPPQSGPKSPSYDSSSEDEDYREQPQINTTFGQAGAFPGLTNEPEDALFYGPAQDGFDYLRMVRNEATTIPYVLSTNVPAITTTEPLVDLDTDGEYYDGFFDEDEAYVARPLPPKEVQPRYSSAQQLCHDAILLRFCGLRARLRLSPTLQTIQVLPESTPISFPESSKVACAAWYAYISKHPPHPVQIAIMDIDSVLELLKLITKKMTTILRSGSEASIGYLGSWIWAILARFPERGELGSEEIAELRACARTAESTMILLCGSTAETDGTSISDDDGSSTAELGTNLDEATPGLERHVGQGSGVQQNLESRDSTKASATKDLSMHRFLKTQTILDMVITVVGEAYGQRDLLELRRPWD